MVLIREARECMLWRQAGQWTTLNGAAINRPERGESTMAQQTAKDGTGSKIPVFRNEQAAVEFWDTHSPLDFPEEFQESEVRFAKPLMKRGLTIRLDPGTIEELRGIGRAKGIGPSTLARMWILEKLRGQRGAP